jgi:DNA-directed RNA polymerase specialized sigma24 family protein
MADENELYEQWRGASADERPEIERQLLPVVKNLARAVVIKLLQNSCPPHLVGETASDIIRSLPSFRGDSKFSTWAYAIAEKKTKMELRSRIRSRKVFDECCFVALPAARPATLGR